MGRKRLGKANIIRKFKRAFAIIKVTIRTLEIIEDIKLYGTSPALFDTKTRPKSSVKEFLYPKHLQKGNINKIEKTPYMMIHPKSKFKNYWTMIYSFMMLYTLTIMPFIMIYV